MSKTIKVIDRLCVCVREWQREREWVIGGWTWLNRARLACSQQQRLTQISLHRSSNVWGTSEPTCTSLNWERTEKPWVFSSRTGRSKPPLQESQLPFKLAAGLYRSPVSAAALTAGHTGTKTGRLMDELSTEKMNYSTVFSHLSAPPPYRNYIKAQWDHTQLS